MEDFNKPKIVYSEIVREPQFYLDCNGTFFPEATVFIMTGEGIEKLYYAFHSKLITYVFKRFYAGGGLGEEGFRYKKAFFEKLPIPLSLLHMHVDELSIEDTLIFLYAFSNEEVNSYLHAYHLE